MRRLLARLLRHAPPASTTPALDATGLSFQPAPGRLPAGQRVYAIGDVHGHAARLRALHARIAEDLARRPVADSLLVQLGDLIDRGPDTAGAIEAARAPACPVGRAVTLLGNHEAVLLAALEGHDPAAAGWWLGHGGDASLHSWGIPAQARPTQWEALIPGAQLDFLRALPAWVEQGGYGFVHAGLRPGRRRSRQHRQDMLWMREPFLSSTRRFGVVVVHGHTPVPEPCVRPNRIGLDTVAAGRLTCAVLEDDRMAFLTA